MPTIEELLLGKPVEKKMEVAEVVEVLKGNLTEEILSPEDSATLLGGKLLPSDAEVIEDQVKRDTPKEVPVKSEPIQVQELNSQDLVEDLRRRLVALEITPEKAVEQLREIDRVSPVDIKVVREFLNFRDRVPGSAIFTVPEYVGKIPTREEMKVLPKMGIDFTVPEYVGKIPAREEMKVLPKLEPKLATYSMGIDFGKILGICVVEVVDPPRIPVSTEASFVEDISLDQVTLPSEAPATKVAYQVVDRVPLKNNRVVLVDGSNMAMRCFFPLKDMCRSDGRRTGLLFGMLKSLRALRRECNALPVLVWDAGGSAKKRSVYAAYKGNRGESEVKTLCFGELQNVKEWLRYLGVPQALQQGEEADDVIGTLAYSTFKDAMVFIHSSDDDFLQLVDDSHCIVVKSVKGGLEFYDSEKVKERMGVPPELVPVFRCFRGDDSDNLPGIPRFQSKKIVELVERHRSISGIYENPEANFQDLSVGAREKISGFRGQAEVNLKLMTLDRGLIPEIQYTPYSAISLKALFEEMEFNSFLGDLEGWEADFGDRSGGFAKVGG